MSILFPDRIQAPKSQVPNSYPAREWAQNNDPGFMASDHRGRSLHAGKRTRDSMGDRVRNFISTDSMARTVAIGGALGGIIGGGATMDPMMHDTVGEFLSPSRIASGGPGALAGMAIGAAAGYKLHKKFGD